MMSGIMNAVRRECARLFSLIMKPKWGVVQSYNPNSYTCQVLLMPERVLTGWIPIGTQWVGNGWGVTCPPTKGDVVEVQFQEGDGGAPYVVSRFFSNRTPPPGPCPSGEFWLTHKSGSLLKFLNTGDIEIVAANTLTTAAVQWNHTGPVNITGNVEVTGNILATGDISDQNGADGTMNGIRTIYNTHTHDHNGFVPDQQML